MKTYIVTIKGEKEIFTYACNTFRTINTSSIKDVSEIYLAQFGSNSSKWVSAQIVEGKFTCELN
jgi:hypothetical protein